MRNLLYTENLKMKRTMGKRLVAIAPLVNMVLSVFAGVLFYSVAMNWWYVFIFSVVIAIICSQIQEKEKKKKTVIKIFRKVHIFKKGKPQTNSHITICLIAIVIILVALLLVAIKYMNK